MEDPCNVENTLCCHALPLIFCCHPGARQEVIMELPKVVKCDPLEPWTVHPKDYLDVPKVLSSTPPKVLSDLPLVESNERSLSPAVPRSTY